MTATLQTLSLGSLRRLRRHDVVERHALKLVFCGLLALSLAGLLYLTQYSALVATRYQIQELQQEKQRLQRERDRLRAEIAAFTSPERVKARAQALGFQTPEQVDYLPIEQLPARVRQWEAAQKRMHLAASHSAPSDDLMYLRQTVDRLLAAVTTKVEAGAAKR